ncbi:M56 family metallopeptidase [Bacteroides sp. 224]|uniref:M56 family metallopeptidase n=1 Tax=Bacteroides sp. 224 TaxID=2302936 RepID=UPI0013D6E363|nr:M56 family metallopeptidase [Bacteroides sp. 224]NDV65256.1 M56 family peptidase [Bacteroides sp. 224]
MSHELTYFLKVNIAIALFYAFYRLFFYKDTFFKWRRTALLCFFLVAACYPLLNIQEWVKSQEPIAAMADLYAGFMLPDIQIEASKAFSWKDFILSSLHYIYWAVCTGLFIRFFIQLTSIIKLAACTKTDYINGVKIHILNKEQGPFSFFKWIFINPDAHEKEEVEEILTHEKTHAGQWHSIDVIISELFCMICWFNPFIWLMKREVRCNLEFMADNKVLEHGYDSKRYQYHLLGLAHHKQVATLSNNFNVLPLKNRIKMMNTKRTGRIGRTKYLMFLPLAALLLIISNIEAIARNTERLAGQAVQPHVALTDTVPFEVVENMPVFPGGHQALMTYLLNNVKFPPEAMESGIQGRVVVQFIVEKDGSVNNPVIVRSIDPYLDKEALRVVSNMPNWTPGTQRGKTVRVKYTIPVSFRPSGPEEVMIVSHNNPTQIDHAEVVTIAYNNSAPTDPSTQVFEVVETMPEFPGGKEGLMNFLAQNIKYPVEAQNAKEEGRVIIKFTITKEGKVTNPHIARGISSSLNAEAIRIINTMPDWKPGKQRGQNVNVNYTVPITFSLNEKPRTEIENK